MKLKKILAGAMAGAMVLGSVVGVSASTTADDVTVSSFLGDSTGVVTLTGDFDVTYTFNNVGNLDEANNNYTNFVVRLIDESSNDLFFRADNWSWLYNPETTITYYCDNTASDKSTIDWYTHTDYDGDWSTWLSAMSAGYDCTVNLSRSGNLITAVMDCGGATFTISANPDFFGDTVTVYLTGEQCELSNVSITGTAAITLSDTSATILTGNTKTVSVTPAFAECTAESADTSIATVTVSDNIVSITGVAAGATTVTVACGNSSQTVDVTVTDDAVAMTAITASADVTDLTVGDTATISITATPSDTTESTTGATYASDDTDVLTVSESGVVTAVAAGEATVTVSIVNEAGDTLTSTVDFTVTETASESEATEASDSTDSGSSSDDADTDESSEESSEASSSSDEKTSGTAIKGTAVDDVICATDDDGTTWWINHSASILLEDGATTTITFKNTTTGTSNWNSGIYVIYTADEAFAGGSGISDLSGYTEYYVCRSDVYGWDGAGVISAATLTTDAAPADDDEWAEWLAAMQAGQDCTITATLDGSTLTVVFAAGTAQTTATITVDADSPVYLSLTGELCELTDIYYTVSKQVSGAAASSDALTSTTGDGKAAVYTVTADTINDASTDYFFVSVTDAAGSYITADVNGNCTYYSAVTGETITVDIYDGEAITLEEGVTYLVNVDRDDDTNSILISFWSEDGSTLLLSYLVEDTDLEDEITTTIVTSDENTGSFTVTASLEDATYSSTSNASGDEGTEGTEAAENTESSTTTVTESQTTSSGDSTPPTGDASPIIPIAVAMLGCAAVVIAGKRRC